MLLVCRQCSWLRQPGSWRSICWNVFDTQEVSNPAEDGATGTHITVDCIKMLKVDPCRSYTIRKYIDLDRKNIKRRNVMLWQFRQQTFEFPDVLVVSFVHGGGLQGEQLELVTPVNVQHPTWLQPVTYRKWSKWEMKRVGRSSFRTRYSRSTTFSMGVAWANCVATKQLPWQRNVLLTLDIFVRWL